jgi:hypothetical protein
VVNFKEGLRSRTELTKKKERHPCSDCDINKMLIESLPREILLRSSTALFMPSEVHRMGKTLPPFSQLIEGERRRWAPFKRALPKADQVLFDRLFDCAKIHIQAGVMVSRPWPFETIVLAILLEQRMRSGGNMTLL